MELNHRVTYPKKVIVSMYQQRAVNMDDETRFCVICFAASMLHWNDTNEVWNNHHIAQKGFQTLHASNCRINHS